MKQVFKKIATTFHKNKSNLLFIIISFGLLVAYIVWKEDIGHIYNTLKMVNPIFLILAVFCMILYWLLEGLTLHIFAKSYYKGQKFSDSFRTSMIGQFFNSITPFASGGQPLQAVYMVKIGMPLGYATCSLLAKFIVFQVVLTLYSTILLVFKINFFQGSVESFKTLAFIGFGVNVAVVIMLFIVANSSRFSKKIVTKVFSALGKMSLFGRKFVKNPDRKITYFHEEIDNFNENFSEIRKQFKVLLLGGFFTFIQLNISFFVTYLVYRSFGLSGASIFTFIAAQAFVQMISSFVPLPGGSGGAELSFLAFFTVLFPQQFITVAMLLWRVITFYLTILVSMFFVGDLILKPAQKEGEKE